MTQNRDSLSGGWRRSLSAEVRGGIATLVSIPELLLLVLALGPFGSRAGAQEGMSTLLFTLPEHSLYPENVAPDPRSGDYFLGSMRRGRFLGTLNLPARFKPLVWRRDAVYGRWLNELDRAYVMKLVRK